jgi:hypothetical protein
MLCNQPHVDIRLAADWMHLKLSPAGLPTPLPKRPRFISYYQANVGGRFNGVEKLGSPKCRTSLMASTSSWTSTEPTQKGRSAVDGMSSSSTPASWGF